MPAGERVVLDTHVWKMYVDGEGLDAKTVRRIDAAGASGHLYVAAVTVWELAMLAARPPRPPAAHASSRRTGARERRKLTLNAPTLAWITEAVHASRVVVYPLDPAIAVDSAELPAFHGDPADRMIVATARHLGAVLVTRDAKILDYALTTKSVRVL